MENNTTDLIIIGAGSGIRVLGSRLKDLNVVVAERSHYGGTCLNRGCIPSKMFVRTAMLARAPLEAARIGVDLEFRGADWDSIRDRVFQYVDHAAESGRERLETQPNITWIDDDVTLDGPNAIVTSSGKRYEARQLVIAAGSRPSLPDIPGVDHPQVHTSDTIMHLTELPHSMIVVGAGAVACEFASVFSALGVQVTQLVRGDTLLKHLDEEVREAFNEQAPRRWTVRYGVETAAITPHLNGTLEVLGLNEPRDSEERFCADIVLMATGRTPNTDRVGVTDTGIDTDDSGFIEVDEYQRVLSDGTPLEGVYSLGDIATGTHLKHVANYEAIVIAHNILFPNDLRPGDGRPEPRAVFTHPEIAQVGMTEAQAHKKFGEEKVASHTHRYDQTAYGIAMNDHEGLLKVIAHRDTGKILGAHVLGYQASLLIQPIINGMTTGVTAWQLAVDPYWIHPALSELVSSALIRLDTNETRNP